jgi:hypothetical protein
MIDFTMPIQRYKQNFNILYKRVFAVDYAMLFNALSTYDWSSLYNEMFADASVDKLSAAVTQAIA